MITEHEYEHERLLIMISCLERQIVQFKLANPDRPIAIVCSGKNIDYQFFEQVKHLSERLQIEVPIIDYGQVISASQQIQSAVADLGKMAQIAAKQMESMGAFCRELDESTPDPAVLKPYKQRKFHTVPGSRQDKYSRSTKHRS